jgi:hypothetical protein
MLAACPMAYLAGDCRQPAGRHVVWIEKRCQEGAVADGIMTDVAPFGLRRLLINDGVVDDVFAGKIGVGHILTLTQLRIAVAGNARVGADYAGPLAGPGQGSGVRADSNLLAVHGVDDGIAGVDRARGDGRLVVAAAASRKGQRGQ